MTRLPRLSAGVLGAVLAIAVVVVQTPANAAIDMVSGARGTAKVASADDCSAKAKAALAGTLQAPFEAGQGSGQWIAFGSPDADGHSSSSAAVHCFPVDKGYVVTLTCAVERPTNAESATDLCGRIQKAFDTQPGVITWQ
ncbi:MAG: hypothetical protein M3R30_06145 [Candidatus Eremiobacteraeota bacterium]|nr:hypothetical protein [Candidatus Eremiobacteraeota bacterium]